MQISKQQAIKELWRRGELSWKMDANQKELDNLYHSSQEKINTWLLARRSGKTYMLLLIAIQVCLKNKYSIVSFLSPTKMQADTNVRPLFRQILEDCPEDLLPRQSKKDYVYTFSNGSVIQIAGADSGHAEKLRGQDAHLVLVDEAGSISNLKYIVNSILRPTTLMTKGKIILASTPPKEEDHEFIHFIERAESKGTLVKKIIYDNPRLTKEEIDQEIEETGGLLSESVRRELFCEVIKDPATSVIPEFDDALIKEIVKEWPLPPHYDNYVSMDLGFKDLTVILFGYYDFRGAKVVIQDELIINFQDSDMTLPKVIDLIDQKEEELWTNYYTNEVNRPTVRVSDINHIVTQEIRRASGGKIAFKPAKKDDNDAAINNLRLLLSNKKIIIHPKCKTLIHHLKNVRWMSGKNKKTFARSPDSGHYDAVDAIKYMIREMNLDKNPYPADYDYSTEDLVVWNKDNFYKNDLKDKMKTIFGVKDKKYDKYKSRS